MPSVKITTVIYKVGTLHATIAPKINLINNNNNNKDLYLIELKKLKVLDRNL